MCVCVCVCSLGPPFCGTGTAWQLLTRGTWRSSPTMRSKRGYRSSFTSLAGEAHTSMHMYTQNDLNQPPVSFGASWCLGAPGDADIFEDSTDQN